MGNAQTRPVHDRRYDIRKTDAARPSAPGKPEVVPDATFGIDPKKGGDVINLKWTAPRYNGGYHITGYLVERRELGTGGVGPGVWVRANAVLARAPRLALASLEPGRRYQFRVSAENAAALLSEPSAPSEPLAIGYQGGVATPPRFLMTLIDTTAVEDQRVDFVVDISGNPAPSICWYKDSTEIFSTRRTRVASGNGRSTLTFHQVGLVDEGEIRCTATNKAGHAVSKAMLKVEARPRIRLPRNINQETAENKGTSIAEDGLLFHLDEVIRLKVGVTGRPQPEVTWYHNGEKLSPGIKDRIEIIDSEKFSSLRILAACRSDRGEYRVTAANIHGQDTSSFLVTVTDRPMPPSDVQAKLMQVGEMENSVKEEGDQDQETKSTSRYYLKLQWAPPGDDGGCRVGSYIVEYYRLGWNVWLKGSTSRQLSLSLDNLIAGSEYRFRVKAENPYGVSDPSPESNTIFLPDPKRGLMEAPERGLEPSDSEWLLEQLSKEEEETMMQEEESREKRKRREFEEDEEWRQSLRRRRMDVTPSPDISPIPSPEWGGKTSPRSDFTTDKEGPLLSGDNASRGRGKMMKETANVGTEGSEFMLVLVPPKDTNAQQEEMGYLDYRRQSTISEGPRELESMEEGEGEGEEEEEEEEEVSMAPPMSLSAPVISGMDGEGADFAAAMALPPLRNAVSSSELLHERAMARIYQAAAEEEEAAAFARRGSVGASSMRRGSASSSRRGSTKDKETWRELGEKMKEEKARRQSLKEDELEEEEEEEAEDGEKEEVDSKEYSRNSEDIRKEEEGYDEFHDEEDEGEIEEEEEYDDMEEMRRIEERDRKRAEAIRKQEIEMTASEERAGGLTFGAGGRTGRMVAQREPPVPPHRQIPPKPNAQRPPKELPRASPSGTPTNHREDSEDVTYRKVPTRRPPVPALHISTIEDYENEGRTLDPTAAVVGHYGDLIREVSSKVRKASPTLFLSWEELKAKAEDDLDPFEHGFIVGETEAERRLELEKEKGLEVVKDLEEEKDFELEKDFLEEKGLEEEEIVEKEARDHSDRDVEAIRSHSEEQEDEVVANDEVDLGKEVVPVPPHTPTPPRVLTPREIAVEERVRLIIDSFTTACLLGVASWLLMNGWDMTAAALVGLIAAKEVYKAIIRRFPFLRRT